MIRHLTIFAATFAVGVIFAVVMRTAMHRPAPAPNPASTPAPVSAGADATAVNTICPICGMAVNPALGTAYFHGKRIGFGCAACPPKFAADPERYGPAALQNRVVE